MSKERRRLYEKRIKRVKRESELTEVDSLETKAPQKPKGMAPNTKLYYIKIITGSISGIISGVFLVLFNIIDRLFWVLFFLSLGLFVSMGIFRYILKVGEEELDSKRLWLSGTFSFVLLNIVVSSLVWMLLYRPT